MSDDLTGVINEAVKRAYFIPLDGSPLDQAEEDRRLLAFALYIEQKRVREQSELIIELGAKLNATKLREEGAESLLAERTRERDDEHRKWVDAQVFANRMESRATAQAIAAAGLREALKKECQRVVSDRDCDCGADDVGQVVEQCNAHRVLSAWWTALSKFPATPDEAEAVAMREVVQTNMALMNHYGDCDSCGPDGLCPDGDELWAENEAALARLTASKGGERCCDNGFFGEKHRCQKQCSVQSGAKGKKEGRNNHVRKKHDG